MISQSSVLANSRMPRRPSFMQKVRINVKILPSVLEEGSLPIYLALEAEPSRNCYPDDLICETI